MMATSKWLFTTTHPRRNLGITNLKHTIRRSLTNEPSNLQVMVFGSGTGVGKTIVSAGVCRAALNRARKVCYIKPVQTR